jgi:hypothetical protein
MPDPVETTVASEQFSAATTPLELFTPYNHVSGAPREARSEAKWREARVVTAEPAAKGGATYGRASSVGTIGFPFGAIGLALPPPGP